MQTPQSFHPAPKVLHQLRLKDHFVAAHQTVKSSVEVLVEVPAVEAVAVAVVVVAVAVTVAVAVEVAVAAVVVVAVVVVAE